MKKILAILMALAMIFSLAACGNKDEDNKKDKNTTEAADSNNNGAETEDDEAEVDAIYDALVSGDGAKIKSAMPKLYQMLMEEENPLESISDGEAALFEQIYGIDVTDPDAIYEFYSLVVLEEFGEVDSIVVEKVDFGKFSEEKIKEKNEELKEEGVEDYEFDDIADGEVEITVVLKDEEEIKTTQKLIFIKEGGDWKVLPDEEDEDEGSVNEGTAVTPPPAADTDDAAINAAATAYYNAIVSSDGASVRNAISTVFAKIIEMQGDLFADLTAEEKAEVEAMFGISLSDPNAFYAYYALMLMSEAGDVSSVQVSSVDYEKYSADEVSTLNDELVAEGVTGINITDFAEAEVEIIITYADGTVDYETQYVSFIEENGAWKVFPEN